MSQGSSTNEKEADFNLQINFWSLKNLEKHFSKNLKISTLAQNSFFDSKSGNPVKFSKTLYVTSFF